MEDNKNNNETVVSICDDYIMEPAKKIPIAGKTQVLVLGGGPAGVCAAVSAGREGKKVVLVEASGDVGGMSTAGLMSHWTGNTQGGIYEEILERSAKAASNDPGKDLASKQVINPEHLKTIYLEMLFEAGTTLWLYTMAVEPIMEGNTIRGVIVENKSGRQAILAQIIIDATGDGDIAARAGVPYILGREKDHLMQPATLMFKVAGVNTSRGIFPECFEDNIPIPLQDIPFFKKKKQEKSSDGRENSSMGDAIGIQDLGKEHLPAPTGHVLLYLTTLPGVITCNMTNCISVDGTRARDITKAMVVCRMQMDKIVEFLRNYVPGFENCYVISAASQIGIRETRHFKGEETITATDIENARIFPDWVVANAYFNFDVHSLTGNGLDITGEQKQFRQTKGYTIPYGCLVPKKVENLYLAGRNISGTHMAHSNFRAMPICANIGQAAGIAASVCIDENSTPRALKAEEVQKRLTELGVHV